ncbi:pilus assembly protein PilZ [Clostridium chromiireducens]|uniref:pilus assembly protein PilZ n=1 Tax=Clostridium chromiireducens TaxID=225345 RepID=UPI003AF65827
MEFINVNSIQENGIVKFITPNKTLFDGVIRKISSEYLGISINIKQKEFIRLNKNESAEFIIVYEHKAVRCSSVILGCSQNDFEQSVIISIPKPIVFIERREFERLSVVLDIEYSPFPLGVKYKDLHNVEDHYFTTLKKTYTVNISGGGVCILVPKDEIDFKYGLISIPLKDEKIVALCEKLRSEPFNNPQYDRLVYKFNDIKPKHRQLIIDFISEKFKEERQSGFGLTMEGKDEQE